VRPKLLAVDIGLAVALAALVLIISPGVAVSGMIALLVLVVCAISFALNRRVFRSRPTRRTPRPSRRRR
jgi:Flp pilus assembly protein TadB